MGGDMGGGVKETPWKPLSSEIPLSGIPRGLLRFRSLSWRQARFMGSVHTSARAFQWIQRSVERRPQGRPFVERPCAVGSTFPRVLIPLN